MILENIGRGALGMVFLIFICYLLSTDRRAINWRLVFFGVLAQIMFAMGVLHNTVNGQPVFWVFFGIILAFTIIRKFRKAAGGSQPVTYNSAWLLFSVLWQLLFVAGLLLAPGLFGPWSGLVMAISVFTIIIVSVRMGNTYTELMKWNVLVSLAILTICIYTKVCPPAIFKMVLQNISASFVSLINISHEGTDFLFRPLSTVKEPWGFVFAIQVLPNIIFFAALSSILYYLGILQKIVYVFAYLLNKLKISGAESLSTAANIFLGQTEAPLMIRPYLEGMTRSEVLCIMVGGMANTAGSVLAAYVGFLGGTDAVQQNYYALHMLSQSIMSAPAAIVCSKLLFPQTNEQLISKDLTVPKEKLGDNFLDALSLGTTDGLKLAVNVGAMLLVYTAVVYLINALMAWMGSLTHINEQVARGTGGLYKELSVQMILGYVFAPVAWLIGVHKTDMISVGQLLGEKTILNEFVAYFSLGNMKANGVIHNSKSILIATYALCGFANFASIGIQIGGISQLAPNQRRSLTELGVRALIGGTIACLMCGCIAGALFERD